MNQSLFAVSNVHAAGLRPGDIILRGAVAGGDREMVIDDIAIRSEGGESVLLFTGLTYALDGSLSGQRVTSPAIGEDCWISPIDAKVIKIVR
jgi:hypothetical protein